MKYRLIKLIWILFSWLDS